jgi:adenosine deaminase CECR1
MSHPLSILLNYNVPVSLSCDDPQFFGNPGLSYDFYQVFTASDTLDIIGLGDLARKSFGFSMMEDEERATEIAKFDIQFDQFLDLVIASSL